MLTSKVLLILVTKRKTSLCSDKYTLQTNTQSDRQTSKVPFILIYC